MEYHEVLGSTSDALKARADHAPEWSVVAAGSQTAGRGRHGHGWISPAGGVYVSVLLRPGAIAPDRRGLLSLAGGLAVAEALDGTGVEARIKWPNDVVVAGRKLAGILAEASAGAGSPTDWVVLGIGLNVNGDPPDGVPSASLRTETGRIWDVSELTGDILAAVALWYDALSHGQADRVVSAWRGRSVAWWGRHIEVVHGGRVVRGVAEDVDADGALLIGTDDGRRIRVVSGEARELRLAGDGAVG